MATLATVTSRIMTLLGSELSLNSIEVESLVQTRYEAIYETFSWSRRLRNFVIPIVPQVSSTPSTSASVTNGNSVVTTASPIFTASMTGRQIVISGYPQCLWFSYVSSTQGSLSDGDGTVVAWPGDSATGLSWRMFKTVYALPSNCQRIVSLAHNDRLEEISGGRYMLDREDPMREQASNTPTQWCYAGADGSNIRVIEIYPVPTVATFLRGQATKEAPALSSSSVIDIPVPLLVYSSAADCCHLLASKQGSSEQMWTTIALFYERKAAEIEKDYRVVESDLSSPLTHLDGSSLSTMRGDWAISHDTSL